MSYIERGAMFAALSILNLSTTAWSCQVVDAINECSLYYPISRYEGTRSPEIMGDDFNGPYSMTFEVDDRGRPLILRARSSLTMDDAEITTGTGLLLSPPTNHKLQIEPGLEPAGAYVWFRWMDGATVREFRFETALDCNAILTELEEMNGEWLARLLQ